MNNYMKTIISGLKQWVSSQKSDWNQNDSSAANFIKNKPFYSEEKEKVLFFENIETADESGFGYVELSYIPYEIGQEYKVIFAGTAYICKAFNNVNIWSGQAVLLGNLGMLNVMTGLEAEDTGEPFFFMSLPEEATLIYTQTAGTYDVSILGTIEEVHQIDKKFVPMPELADVAHTGDYYDLQNTPTIPWDTVQYATSQSLPDSNKKIARNNIGAAAATDVSTLNTSVNNLNTLVGDTAVSTQIENATDECITGMSVSGKVITYTKRDGSKGTITTQDTNTTYNLANGTSSGLCSGNSYSTGSQAISYGQGSIACGSKSFALGQDAVAAGMQSSYIGIGSSRKAIVSGEANALVYQVKIVNSDDMSIFRKNMYVRYYNVIAKITAIDLVNNTITLNKTLNSSSAIYEGLLYTYRNIALGEYSHARGYDVGAHGYCSSANGIGSSAYGDYSYAFGESANAIGKYSSSKGKNTLALGEGSHAEGKGVEWNNNIYVTGEGNSVTYQVDTLENIKIGTIIYCYHKANITRVISIDENNSTITLEKTLSETTVSNERCLIADESGATGKYSHSEGYETTASGNYSHAEGDRTTASSYASHAEGYHTTASGSDSHAEGNYTLASGSDSHAEGYNTTASGSYSHSEGENTIAASKNQHVQGKNNVADSAQKYAHIVGNGESNIARSNAHTIDWDGVGWYKGDLKVGGTGQDDETAKSVLLTPNEEETLEMLTEMELVDPVGEEGFIYTDENGVMYTLI